MTTELRTLTDALYSFHQRFSAYMVELPEPQATYAMRAFGREYTALLDAAGYDDPEDAAAVLEEDANSAHAQMFGTPPAPSYAEQHQRAAEQRHELPANRLKG